MWLRCARSGSTIGAYPPGRRRQPGVQEIESGIVASPSVDKGSGESRERRSGSCGGTGDVVSAGRVSCRVLPVFPCHSFVRQGAGRRNRPPGPWRTRSERQLEAREDDALVIALLLVGERHLVVEVRMLVVELDLDRLVEVPVDAGGV